MAGVPPSERNQRPGEENLGGSPLNPLSQFLRLGQEHGLTEDDMWSDDPERRRFFYIHDATIRIERHLKIVRERLGELPANCRQALLTGRAGEHIVAAYFPNVPSGITPVYREPIAALVSEIKDIMHEKGFRHSSALYSPREHQEVGSSDGGGIYRETDPDVPIPLLRARLVRAGRIGPESDPERTVYTFEEIDRARRLMGMSVLDPETGRVTDQIDQLASNDSYIFLPQERKAEVIVRESKILAEVEEITRKAQEDQEKCVGILPVLDAYSRGEQPFADVGEVYEAVLARLSEQDNLSLVEPIKELRKIAFAAGKWDYLLTPQEIFLRVGAEVDERYLEKPYTPLAIQDGTPAEEVKRLRQAEGSIVVNTVLLEYEKPFGFRLEELDEHGDTIKSPTFLAGEFAEEEMSEEAMVFYRSKIQGFPFARPGDWHSSI